MTRTARVGALSAVAVSLVLALAGCVAPAPVSTLPPDAASAPPTTTAPTAEPVDPLSTVTAIAAGSEGLVLTDTDGAVVASYDYYAADAASVAVALGTVFGTPAVVQESPGGQEVVPSTRHTWGPFTMIEQRYVNGWDRSALVPTRAPSFVVEITGAQTAGVMLATTDGRAVGEPWAEVRQQPAFQVAGECAHAFTDAREQVVTWYDGSAKTERIVVDLISDDDGSAVAMLRVPVVETGCV
ncbi:hypothetical protein ACGGZK_15845 [Agromyces sp. MMS24-K17]|uniref:hypothetical protein n=1 Tax=Agromyces sp. MMS24-K17 TaxID=3372850 RepID=UPI0037540B49